MTAYRFIPTLIQRILGNIKRNKNESEIMNMKTTYYPQGVCSNRIDLEVENNIIKEVKFYNGCNGNLKAIAALLKGMEKSRAIDLLKGITCNQNSTSCSDQLARALEEMS